MPEGAQQVPKIAGATQAPVPGVLETRLAFHRLFHGDVPCPSTPVA